jgi:hypothetical protein
MNPSNIIYGTFLLVAVLGAGIHLVVSRHTLSLHRFSEVVLVWTFVPLVGVPGLFSGMFHVFDPQLAAAAIGWQVSPFQREVGFADLGVGVLGILAARLRGLFWWATGIWSVIFLGGAAIGHIIEQQSTGNFAPGNAGVVFWLDMLVPLLLIVLLPIYQWTKDHRLARPAAQPA